jgi:hypothetical protein
MQQDNEARKMSNRYRLFVDPGHSWLEVPRREVVASGTEISGHSYHDPATDMAYLEEDCDAPAFLKSVGQSWQSLTVAEIDSSMPRRLPSYDPAAFMDSHILIVRPDNTGAAR